MDLNILNDSEFLKSAERVTQICGPFYTIESIPYFTADLQLAINDLGFLKEYGQSFLLNASLIICGAKPFKNLWISFMRIFFMCMVFSFAILRSSLKIES